MKTSPPTNRRHFLQSTAGMVAASTSAGLFHSLDCSAQATPQTEHEWIDLFDGKSLDGWHTNPEKIGHGTGGNWQVEEGAITGEQDPPGSGNGGILLTDRKFGDFELLIDIKPDWGICSGLFVRSNDAGQCFQMMVDYHDAGNVGHVYGEGTGGFNTRTFDINGKYQDETELVGITTANHKTRTDVGLVDSCAADAWVDAWKIDDWNTIRVRVRGQFAYITTWINELKVCEFDGNTSACGGYKKEAVFTKLGREGSIAVQVHGGGGWPSGAKCRWKNIKIRTI